MDTEFERAARGAAQRKLNEGLEARDPVRAGRRFEKRPRGTRILAVIAILCVLAIIGLAMSYVVTIPPAHILIVLMAIGVLWVWLTPKKRN